MLRSLHGLLTLASGEPPTAVPGSAELRRGPSSSPARSWRPLLSPAEAEQALVVACEIADALVQGPAAPAAREGSGRLDLSLGQGLAGIALFFAYLDRALPGRGYGVTAGELANAAVERIGDLAVGGGLYGGIPGVAWLVEHLEGWILDFDGEDAGLEVAEVLAEHLGRSPWRGEWDLIMGLAGFGVWALERRPRAGAGECLEQVVSRLAEAAERGPGGAAWRKTRVPGGYRAEDFPEGLYNLGVAHGTPGVIGLLGEAAAGDTAGAVAGLALPLLGDAVAWLLAQKLPPGDGARFPPVVGPGIVPAPSRIAWCYGDLGIAAVLLGTARRAGRGDWEDEALSLARAAAARPPESSEVVDPGLCHGAIGVAHLFNRLYQATGDPALAGASRAWLERGLAMRRPGTGLAGFLAWQGDAQMEFDWRAEPGLLYGGAGIGLALLAAATAVEPAWDRVMLISIP